MITKKRKLLNISLTMKHLVKIQFNQPL